MTYTAVIKNQDKRSLRKVKKCEVEKRRRERIEISLEHMKTLVLSAYGKNSSDYEKMEKADIMEMTVSLLATVTRAQQSRHVMSQSPYQMPRDSTINTARQIHFDVNNNHVPRHLLRPVPQSPGLLMVAPVAGFPHIPVTSPMCVFPSTSPASSTGTDVWRPW